MSRVRVRVRRMRRVVRCIGRPRRLMRKEGGVGRVSLVLMLICTGGRACRTRRRRMRLGMRCRRVGRGRCRRRVRAVREWRTAVGRRGGGVAGKRHADGRGLLLLVLRVRRYRLLMMMWLMLLLLLLLKLS